jgi:hypothetical protein
MIRDGYRAFPTCRRDARSCDLDHVDPYPAGPTSADNLTPLHRQHHRMKTAKHWNYHRNPDGSSTWQAPSGRTYHNHPTQRW